MQTLANWRELNFDKAKAELLAQLFPTHETMKDRSGANAGVSGAGGSDKIRAEAGDGAKELVEALHLRD